MTRSFVVRRDVVALDLDNETTREITFEVDVCSAPLNVLLDRDFRELCVVIFDIPIKSRVEKTVELLFLRSL